MGQTAPNAEHLGYAVFHVFAGTSLHVYGDSLSTIKAHHRGPGRSELAPAAYAAVWRGTRQAGYSMNNIDALHHVKAPRLLAQVVANDKDALRIYHGNVHANSYANEGAAMHPVGVGHGLSCGRASHSL